MLNEHDPRGTVIPLDSRENSTIKIKTSQGRRRTIGSYLPRIVVSALASVGAIGSAIALDATSPQASASSTEITRGSGKMTLIAGPEIASKNSIDVQFLLKDGISLDQVRTVEPGLTYVKPMDQYKGQVRSWAIPVQNLECDLEGVRKGRPTACKPEDIKREVRITKEAGITPFFTVVLAPSGIENWGAGLATLRDPFAPFSINDGAHILMMIPPKPNVTDILVLQHEILHNLGLDDTRMVPNGRTNVGKGFFNCSRTPQETWGWAPTIWKGCDGDSQAFINTNPDDDNMRDSSTGKIAPENWPYIQKVWSRLPFIGSNDVNLPSTKNIALQSLLPDSSVYKAADLGFTLGVEVPPDITCVWFQFLPAVNPATGVGDGPGYNNILCGEDNYKSITFPKPEIGKGGYFLLPNMTYTYTMRFSNSQVFVGQPEKPEWKWNVRINPYTGQEYVAETRTGLIQTPPRYSDKISLVSPKPGETVGPKSVIQWANGDKDVFYYETKVSRDPNFEEDPAKAVAAVYYNLIHGGQTNPLNSWSTPDGYGLEEGTNYVSIRPRIQGDGTPVPWSQTFSFNVSGAAGNKLAVSEYGDPVYVSESVNTECIPTIGLEPQIIGSRPHFITPSNCYTLMGEPAQPDGSPLVISPVR